MSASASQTPISGQQSPQPPMRSPVEPETLENPKSEARHERDEEDREGGEEEEEEGECGFCLFMKGGGCKDTFVAWEKCIEEAEKNQEDIVEKCFQATAALKKCMEAHSDYYEPILRAEKAAEEEAVKELEREAAAAAEGSEQSGNASENKSE